MSQVNFDAMTDQELKQYFLTHRNDQAAFHAYMDRRRTHPRQVISADDPDWEGKAISAFKRHTSGNQNLSES